MILDARARSAYASVSVPLTLFSAESIVSAIDGWVRDVVCLDLTRTVVALDPNRHVVALDPVRDVRIP